jgi:hypothetical protein
MGVRGRMAALEVDPKLTPRERVCGLVRRSFAQEEADCVGPLQRFARLAMLSADMAG